MITKGTHEREYYVAMTYIKLGMDEKLRKRWKEINYTPKNIQLKLF